jgi:hypothetical protein
LGVGALVALISAVVPAVMGEGAESAKVDLLDGAAWLANESVGHVVRVNGTTGRVDARVEMGAAAGAIEIEHTDDGVLVRIGGDLLRIDVANLDWGASTSVDGDVVVGDDVVYVVHDDGTVQQLDPTTLEPLGDVHLDGEPGHGVIASSRLVLPLDDGTVQVIDGTGVVDTLSAGEEGDALKVAVVGDEVAILNLTAGTLMTADPITGDITDGVDVDLPEGAIVVPDELPAGPLWLLSVREGQLLSVDTETGEVEARTVAERRADLTGPVAIDGRVYLVDRTAGEVVEVDAETLEVVRRESLGLDDASRVEVIVEGGKVFVNDRASAVAVVIDGDDYTRVDKYSDDGVAGSTPPVDDVTPPETPPADAPDPPAGSNAPSNPSPGSESPDPTTAAPPTPTEQPGAPPAPDTPTPTTPTPPSTEAPVTPPTDAPAAPIDVQAVAGNQTATVSWVPGGGTTAPTRYYVTYDGLDQPLALQGNVVTTTFPDLENGQAYVFEVWATNQYGESDHVNSDEVVPNDEVPGPPADVAATAGDGTAHVTWTAANGRGNAIDHYAVTTSPGGATVDVPGGTTQADITGLANGTSYTFTVTAVNALGNQSEPSAASNAVMPHGVPGPITLTAGAGDGSANLTWTAAESQTEVTYHVSANPAPASGPAPIDVGGATSYQLTGLTNGVTYDVTVEAYNDRGLGGTRTANVTPGRAPDVGAVTATRTGDRQFQVAYTIDGGGYPLTGCSVTSSAGGSADCSGGAPVTFDVPNYGGTYTFTVTATTALGSDSGTANGTAASKPLTVDGGTRWDGACTWRSEWGGTPWTRPYYTNPAHACPNDPGGPVGYVADGAVVRGQCVTNGGSIQDDEGHPSSQWIRVEGYGWMSPLYFVTWSTATANLPGC